MEPAMPAGNTVFAITPTTSPEALALLQTLLNSGALKTVAAPTQAPVTPLTSAESTIAAIPVAEDGLVIHADFHNSLRDALASLLAEVAVGRGPVAPLSPAFLPVEGEDHWSVFPGFALVQVAAGGAKGATGWLPVELPHGGEIQNLTVTGRRTGAIQTIELMLIRQELTGDQSPKTETIADVVAPSVDGPFTQVGQAGAPSINVPTPAQVAEHRTIDNTKFKYFVTAEVLNAAANSRVQINAIQVVVQRV